ncbi:MAG: helix-turn-helix transcriptional regulator [Bacteroidetes bacterium]|nr:helix-turn-helix transcriptional regulator [Bacteroidota bacterium]
MENTNINALSDSAIVETLSTYIKHHRLQQNKTQSQLAIDANINRSTLVEFEKGKRANLITFIQLLRALNLLDVLMHFEIKQQLSPIQLAKLDQLKRKRASKKTVKQSQNKKKPKSNW